MQDYEYLLSSLNKLQGVGKKTYSLFVKKILTLYLIYCGVYLNKKLRLQKKLG